MTLRNSLNLSDIIIGFEQVLKIEHNTEVPKLILASRQKLESAFQIQIKDNVYELQNEAMVRDSVQSFLAQVTECLKQMSMLTSLSMFDKKFSVNLYEVNYLGFAKDNLFIALRYLQDEVLYEKRDTFMPSLIRGVSRIETSRIRRLLIILVVLEDLGIKEGVAIISTYLYMGSYLNA